MYAECVFDREGIRVYELPFSQGWQIKQWMEGDNPRSYGTHYDYFITHNCFSVDEVNNTLKSLLQKKREDNLQTEMVISSLSDEDIVNCKFSVVGNKVINKPDRLVKLTISISDIT